MKSGLISTEFWLSALAVVLGFLAEWNALPTEGIVAQAIALVMGGLVALGYQYNRTGLKKEESKKLTASKE